MRDESMEPVAFFLASFSLLTFPQGHCTQLPSTPLLPAGHASHVKAPTTVVNRPLGQSSHVEEQVDEVAFEIGHCRQADDPSEW